MTLNRRHLAIAAAGTVAAALTLALPANAESPDEAAVGKALEGLRVAMFASDAAALEKLCAAELSYGHSAGRIETKAEFIAATTKPNPNVVRKSLSFNDRTIHVAGANAITRFTWVSQSETEGKLTETKIGVLAVWTKQGADWKLMARQAFRLGA